MKLKIFPLICMSLLASFAHANVVLAQQGDSILTDNVVELKETKSPQGFIHPGISGNAETLSVMREKVKAGASPWVDYFEGMRRTRYANPNQKPARVEQILNDGGIGGFARDAQLAWVQTILYVVTGNEEYRKLPVEIINWYGSRTDKNFFPQYFSDSHIKIGKYVHTMCSAVDILRATTPKDKQLAVTQEMIDALQKNCIYPIRKNCIERNDYFMNQHSYAIMGYLASTVMGDEVEDYKQAVEWTTVNATSPNQGRNGAIKPQVRLVTRNDKTGETVKPNLQLVEMGRDMPHAEGNITNLLMMSRTIDFQKTKVDPVAGTVTDKANGVSPIHFLDDRLPKGAALYTKFNMGYELPWVPTYSETDPKHPDYGARYDYISPRGRGSFGSSFHYYQLKGAGVNLETGPLRYIKDAFDATAYGRDGVRSGVYLDSVHNYGFDFWVGLPASVSDAAPNPEKAKRALAKVLPPLEVTYNGAPIKGEQVEYRFVDLSALAEPGDIYPGSPKDIPLKVSQDADGTGYVRMTTNKEPRTMVITNRFPVGAGLRVRSDSPVQLSFYREGDFARRGSIQEIIVPSTKGQWNNVIANFEGNGIVYIQATPLAGSATIDFDRVETDLKTLRPVAIQTVAFSSVDDNLSIPTFVGANIKQVFSSKDATQSLTYSALNLPAGAEFTPSTGTFSWTPTTAQKGDYTFYVTAQDGDTVKTVPVHIYVARNLQGALNYVARTYDPKQRYVTSTEQAFKAARKSGDLPTLQRAVAGLELLNPRLPDGTLDYRVASGPPPRVTDINMMADDDPFTWGGIWGFDKNITMDFGNRFKVKVKAFRMQPRDGHPSRITDAVVYGSNDRKNWTLLTKNKAVVSSDRQTLPVKEEEQKKLYRYLRLFMPAKPLPIFEVAEFRIVGERVEDYSPDYHIAYISGFKDGTFRPGQKLTKAEAVSLLAGLVDYYTDKGVYTTDFVDVPRNSPYYDDVAYMSSKGIGDTWSQPVKYVTADNEKRFYPEAPISRGEVAGIMARMQGLKGDDGPQLKDVTTDTPNAAEIRRVVREGWLTGDETGAFRPNDAVTRAEFVVAANKMLGRHSGAPIANAHKFNDVDKSYWAYNDIVEASTTHPVQLKEQNP